MLHSADHRLFFIHIPKCAGTSINHALEDFASVPTEAISRDLDTELPSVIEDGRQMYFDHSRLGPIHLGHVPLPILRREMPETHGLLRRSFAFAVLRDPRSRFLSAVAQRLREFEDVGATRIDNEAMARGAQEAIDWLKGRGRFCDRSRIHFAPQSWFIEDEGDEIDFTLFSVSQMPQLAAWLSRMCKKPIQIGSDNRTVRPKGRYRWMHRTMAGAAKTVLPQRLRSRIAPLAFRLPIYASSASAFGTLRLPASAERFITDYYARDWALLRSTELQAKAG